MMEMESLRGDVYLKNARDKMHKENKMSHIIGAIQIKIIADTKDGKIVKRGVTYNGTTLDEIVTLTEQALEFLKDELTRQRDKICEISHDAAKGEK